MTGADGATGPSRRDSHGEGSIPSPGRPMQKRHTAEEEPTMADAATAPQNAPLHPGRQPRLYGNVVLTAIAALLGVIAFDPLRSGAGPSLSAPAQAQSARIDEPDEGAGRISAAEQRKVMIAELRTLSSRLERVEAVLQKGLNVRVTEMPEMRQAPEPRTDRKPAP